MASTTSIQRLDHITVRTRKPAETVRFFTEVVGLTEGWRPGFNFPGHWLYNGDTAVLHIVSVTDNEAELRSYLGTRTESGGTGAVDHIAFRCHGLDAMQQHLIDRGQHFRERVVPDIGEHQLFLQDPNGINIELVFPHAESNRVRGERVAAPAMSSAGR
ncbi:MAG TPA: VOC family protein [Dongiaceae bacterium]|nr:VOC family protein [Dongiaceae bacterium]